MKMMRVWSMNLNTGATHGTWRRGTTESNTVKQAGDCSQVPHHETPRPLAFNCVNGRGHAGTGWVTATPADHRPDHTSQCYLRRGIASPVAVRRGEGAQRKRCRDLSCSGGLRPLVELCVEPAGLCGRCTGVAAPLRATGISWSPLSGLK